MLRRSGKQAILALLSGALLIGACSRKYEANSPWGYLLLSEETAETAAAVTPTVESYSSVIQAETSLLAYWRLNESANPVVDSKSTNNGALTGVGTPTSQTGATSNNDSDNALCLNDTETFRVIVPNNSALEFTTGNSMTLEAWFKPNVLNPKMALITQGRTTGTDNSNYTIRINGAKLGFFFGDAGSANNAVYRTDDYIFKQGNWYHIVVTHTYGSIADTAIYINGVKRNGSWIVGAGTEAPDVAGEALWIGATDSPAAGTENNVIGGCVDEVAIYNSILGISDIRTHYRVANNRFVKLLPAKNVLGASDSLFLDVVGGTSPYTFSIVSGSGTITSSGNFTAPTTMGATVVRVTDADGNTDDVTLTAYQEPDNVANLQAWFKADSVNVADGAAVATWSDSSGNGNDATAGTAPTFSEGLQHGLPAIVFNGTTTNLNLTSITNDPNTQAHTMFAVINVTIGANRVLLAQQDGGGTGRTIFSYFTAGTAFGTVPDGGVRAATTVYPGNTTILYSKTWDTSNLNFFLAGAADGSYAGITWTSANGPWMMGVNKAGASHLSGGIAELLLYNASLAATDRQAIECYLGEKWNITIDAGNNCP